MRLLQSAWIEDSDELLVKRCLEFGVRPLAREIKVSPSLISRWLKGRNGMEITKVKNVQATIKSWLAELSGRSAR